jgi:methionyl-tRNA synthetase
MELRAGKVLAAERVPKKDKLLKLSIDLGEATPRTIVSGVAQSYAPEELVGKVVCVVANLPPRDFGKGLVSHGMVLYASGGDREHTAIELPSDVKPGSAVK